MEAAFGIKISIYFIIAVLPLLLIQHLVKNGKRSPSLYILVAFQLLVFLWAAHDLLLAVYTILPPEIAVRENIYMLIYVRIEFFLTCFTGYFWMLFGLFFVNHRLTKKKIVLYAAAIPPAVFYIMHTMDYFLFDYPSRFGKLYLLYAIVSYAYLFLGTAILALHTLKQSELSRKQAFMLSLCTLLPLITNIIQNIRFHIFSLTYEIYGIDATLAAFSLTTLIIIIAISKYRLLNTTPFAYKELFSSIDQPVVVLDNGNSIIDFNNSFLSCFSKAANIGKNNSIQTVLDLFKEEEENEAEYKRITAAIKAGPAAGFNCELLIRHPASRIFSIHITPVFINKKVCVGKVLIFSDITELRESIRQLEDKNEELSGVNEQLKAYTATVEELAIEKERNRIARDMHDTLGHSFTLLITMLKGCMIALEKDTELLREKLSKTADIARQGLNELRRSVAGLLPGKLDSDTFQDAIGSLIRDFETSGLNVEISMEGLVDPLHHVHAYFLYRLCQEAMTNSVRHGNATRMTIIVQQIETLLRVFITDNGSGRTAEKKGQGLLGMEQRVEELNGTIKFGSNDENGFNIYLEIPMKAV